MYVALLCRCNMVSYEICQAPAAIAISLQQAVAETCGDENYAMGSHAFIHGDMIVEPSVGQAIACAMVILINNKEFQPLLTMWLNDALKSAQPGTYIIVTERLGNIRHTAHSSAYSQNAHKSNDIALSMDELPVIRGHLGSEQEERLHTKDNISRWGFKKMVKEGSATRNRRGGHLEQGRDQDLSV
ncbi:hypothetical protein B0H14DRAFT_2554997 [Mycena olivaceomarginata]|nr:hypothetical protein B0H14DRAFT_2554997 [Mycena olivaceomarginata]